MKLWKILSFFSLILPLCSCNGNEEDLIIDNEFQKISISEAEIEIVNNSQYQLGGKVFKELINSQKDNFAFSPLELYFTLGELSNITENESKNEVIKFLNKTSTDNINSLAQTLLLNLPSVDKTSEISLINGLWYSTDLCGELNQTKSTNLEEYFHATHAGFPTLDSKDVLNYINDWADEKSNSKISSILPSIPSKYLPILMTNALYFKGLWKTPFDSKLTANHIFNSDNGEKNSIPMLRHKELKARGFGTDRYTAVALPYGNEAFKMIIVLPDEGRSIRECLTADDMDRFQRLAMGYAKISEGLGAMSKSLNILLPKFTLESFVDLTSSLENLGISSVFNSASSNFSGFSKSSDLYVGRLIQSSKISVDENGCKVVNITSGEIPPTASFAEMCDFIVDKPFFFLITESSTGSVLLFGRINNL